jgi:hypothetical protein
MITKMMGMIMNMKIIMKAVKMINDEKYGRECGEDGM